MCKLCDIGAIVQRAKVIGLSDEDADAILQKLSEISDAHEGMAAYVKDAAPGAIMGYIAKAKKLLGVKERKARPRGPLDIEAAVAAAFLGSLFGGKFNVPDGNGPAVTILDLNEREPGESPLDFLARKLGER
jgi:hypothetical protein